MLVKFFLDIIFNSFNYILGLFPSLSLPIEFINAWGIFGGYVSAVGFLLPMDTVRNCLIIIASFYAIEFGFAVSNYFFRKIPTVS
jgi:hypothetical protein